jgi:hypothetical protein
MSYVTPVMAITTAILSIVMDPWHDFRASHFFDSWAHILKSSLLMLLGGSLAFFMVWSITHSWELKHLLQCILRYIFSCTKDVYKIFQQKSVLVPTLLLPPSHNIRCYYNQYTCSNILYYGWREYLILPCTENTCTEFLRHACLLLVTFLSGCICTIITWLAL